MDESALQKDLKSGNPEAFKQFVDHYQSKVINTCYGFVHNREDAEDIAQEVFLEVYTSITRFREEAKLSTWIYRICVTKSLDFIRKKKRKKRFGFIRNILGVEKQIEQIPASPTTNPQTNLEQQERARILQQAVDSLAENQRIAITLSKDEGFSYQEIADIMGTSVSAIESLIHRAKKNLQKKLYQYYEKQ
jgi:RNA polymerase sigma-70 factor (ECF subfamily)